MSAAGLLWKNTVTDVRVLWTNGKLTVKNVPD
jgi:hypothetical protein